MEAQEKETIRKLFRLKDKQISSLKRNKAPCRELLKELEEGE